MAKKGGPMSYMKYWIDRSCTLTGNELEESNRFFIDMLMDVFRECHCEEPIPLLDCRGNRKDFYVHTLDVLVKEHSNDIRVLNFRGTCSIVTSNKAPVSRTMIPMRGTIDLVNGIVIIA